MDREKAFQLLEIVPGDSLEAAKAKYRIKAKQCHPDRFGHDPKLMKAAEVKMTQVNIAYQVACTHLKSNKKSSDGPAQSKPLISWLSWLNWSMAIGKPLLQKAVGIFGSHQPGAGTEEGRPVNAAQDSQSPKAFARESFDDILQRKVADMKSGSHHDK